MLRVVMETPSNTEWMPAIYKSGFHIQSLNYHGATSKIVRFKLTMRMAIRNTGAAYIPSSKNRIPAMAKTTQPLSNTRVGTSENWIPTKRSKNYFKRLKNRVTGKPKKKIITQNSIPCMLDFCLRLGAKNIDLKTRNLWLTKAQICPPGKTSFR